MTVSRFNFKNQGQEGRLIGSLKVSGLNTEHGASKYFKSGSLHLECSDPFQINLVVNIGPDETRRFNIIKHRLSAKAYQDTASLYIQSEIDRTFTLNFRLDIKKMPTRVLRDFANALNDEIQKSKSSGHGDANNNCASNGHATNTHRIVSPSNNNFSNSPLKKLVAPSNALKETLRGGIESFYGSPRITDTASRFSFGRSPGNNKSLVPKATEQLRSMKRLDVGANWSDGNNNNNDDDNNNNNNNNNNLLTVDCDQNQLFTSLITDKKRPDRGTDGQEPSPGESCITPTESYVSPTNQSSSMGFANLGNTCYMNAVLQPLLAIPCFQNDLMNPKHVQLVLREAILAGINNSNISGPNSPSEDKENNFTNFNSNARESNSKKDTHLYKVLVQLLATKVKRDKGQWKEGSLDSRTQFLLSLKKAVASVEQQFAGHTQNDAHEFLSLCLDLLREEVVRINRSLPSLRNDAIFTSPDSSLSGRGHEGGVVNEGEANWPPNSVLPLSEMDCPVNSNFQLTVKHTILCTGCGFEQDHSEKMLILSVYLPEPKNETSQSFCLAEAFKSFFNEETLEYTCDGCGHKEAKLQHTLLHLPRVLIIHLKRYKVHHELGSVSKDFRNVQIPKYIDVESVVSANSSLPKVPQEVKEPELENVLRRLSRHNRLELHLPTVDDNRNETQAENNSSVESSLSRLDRLNAYESGYNSATTTTTEASSSHSAGISHSQQLSVVIPPPETGPLTSSDELSQKYAWPMSFGKGTKSTHDDQLERAFHQAQEEIEVHLFGDETPCKAPIDSSEDDDRNLASIRNDLRTKATKISPIGIETFNGKLSPGRDMEMRTPERKTPEKKSAARDFLEELPPKLSKLSQSARKFLSPIRGPKSDGSDRGSKSEMAPRSRDRASTMFDDAMESDDVFSGKGKLTKNANGNAPNTTPRQSRRLLFKRNAKAKLQQELDAKSIKSAEVATRDKEMDRKRSHKTRVLERGAMDDPQEDSDLAEAIHLSMQHHLETQEQRDLEMAMQLSRESISSTSASFQPHQGRSQSESVLQSYSTQNLAPNACLQREQPTIKIERALSTSQESDSDVFTGTILDKRCFTEYNKRELSEEVLHINKFNRTDFDNCSEPEDIKPTFSSSSYAPGLNNNGLPEFTVISETSGRKPRERVKVENKGEVDDVMQNYDQDGELMEIDFTYDTDEEIIKDEEEPGEEVFVDDVESGCRAGIKQDKDSSPEDTKKAVTPPPVTSHDLSLAELRVISTPSPGKTNRSAVLEKMDILSADFCVHPTPGQEEQGALLSSQTFQEENTDGDTVEFAKLEDADDPLVADNKSNVIIGIGGASSVDNNTILNCRVDEEDGEGDIFMNMEGNDQMDCYIEDITNHMRDPKEEKTEDDGVYENKDEPESNSFSECSQPEHVTQEKNRSSESPGLDKSSASASEVASASQDFSAHSYQLMSIICHLGQSASVGHYVSDVYNPETGTWCCFDDETVNSRDEANVLTSRQKPGYIFFYMHRSLFPDLHTP